MSEPRAGLILAAEDMTAAAFNSANRNLNTLERNAMRASSGGASGFRGFTSSVMSARSALASLGVVLSGRALFAWMSNAVQATTAVGQQREEVMRAKSAFADFRAATDGLAESLAVRLEPAIRFVAKALDDFRRNRDGPSVLDTFNAQLAEARQQVETLPLEIARLEAFRGTGGEGAQALAALEQRLAKAKELAGILGAAEQANKLEDIDVAAIGRKAIPVNPVDVLLERQREKEREAAAEQHAVEQQEALDAFEAFTNARLEREREEQEQADRRRELLEQHVEDVRLNLLTETEYQAEMYARQQEILDQALEQKLISERDHAQLSVELERETSRKIAEIRKQEELRDRQLRLVKLGGYASLAAGIAAITSVGAEDSKKKFETHKKIATAAAIVDTYAAVAYALRNPPGPPFSIPQAVAAGLFGFAQVKAIQSTTWSGGGAGGFGAGGGGGEVAATPLVNDRTAGLLSGDGSGGRGAPQINITITGIVGRVDGETAREIGRAIGDEINNHDFEFMARSSRQVLTIRGEGVQGETP